MKKILEEVQKSKESLEKFFEGPFEIREKMNDSLIVKTNKGMYKITLQYAHGENRLTMERISF